MRTRLTCPILDCDFEYVSKSIGSYKTWGHRCRGMQEVIWFGVGGWATTSALGILIAEPHTATLENKETT